MRLSKTISALFLSFVILFASLTQANAKRLHAAIADWTGGIITCEVAVAILEREMGYKIKQTVFPSGTGLWEAIAAGELDFACESWPSYAEADDVIDNSRDREYTIAQVKQLHEQYLGMARTFTR